MAGLEGDGRESSLAGSGQHPRFSKCFVVLLTAGLRGDGRESSVAGCGLTFMLGHWFLFSFFFHLLEYTYPKELWSVETRPFASLIHTSEAPGSENLHRYDRSGAGGGIFY